MELLEILKKERVFAIVGSKHTGKTTALFNFIDVVKKAKNNFCFCYHQETKDKLTLKYKNLRFFDTLEEFEQIHDSFIFIDEFHQLFKTEDRHKDKLSSLKHTFNQLEHNNNIVIICGTTEYYNKLVCSFIPDNNYILCKVLFKDFVNGSKIKDYVLNLGTDLRGGTLFNIPLGKIFYKGVLLNITYDKTTDKKSNRYNLFEGLK